jgi:hypothetical protein
LVPQALTSLDRDTKIICNVPRFSAILLLLAVAAVGSGALRYAHELEHASHDAHHDEDSPAPPHDESNCFTHAQLKLPMLGAGHVPVLVCIGIFVAFLTLLHAPVRSRRPFLLLDSRGPPALPLLQLV